MNAKTLGQIGYEAYGEAADWKTFDGRPMPTWEQLGTTEAGRETRRRWEVAAEEIARTARCMPVTIRVRRADGSIAAEYTNEATGRAMAGSWRRVGCKVYSVTRKPQ